jgi:hypothetical protein
MGMLFRDLLRREPTRQVSSSLSRMQYQMSRLPRILRRELD